MGTNPPHPRVLDWLASSRPYALAAMLSGPRGGSDPSRNANYGRWAKAVELACDYDNVMLVGSGHSGEKDELRRELRVVDRKLGLHHPKAKYIDDRAPHTAANVANLLRVGRVMFGFPVITDELLKRPITFRIATNDFHGQRVLFLADVIQRWLALRSRRWAATLPFRFEIAPVGIDDLDPDWIQGYIDAEAGKMAESRNFALEWFNNDLRRAPTMMRRVASSRSLTRGRRVNTELTLRRLVESV